MVGEALVSNMIFRNFSLSSAEHRFSSIVVGLVGLGFLAVLITGVAGFLVLRRGQEHAQWGNHAYLVERHVYGIMLSLEEMRSGRRGILIGLDGSEKVYRLARERLNAEIASVEKLTQDNPAQQARVRELHGEVNVLDSAIRGATSAQDRLFRMEEQVRGNAVARLIKLTQHMLDEESNLLAERAVAQQKSLQTFYVILAAAGLLLVLVGGTSILVIIRYTRDLGRTRDELRELNANLESAVKVRTQDLQRANEEIQRFAYIVSHDLRSPLVNVMGFTGELEASIRPLTQLIERVDERDATLVPTEARLAVEEDLPEALGFIRASTQKMDRLISAILRLSREGRRNISPSSVALTPLANGIVDGIRHLIDDSGAVIEVHSKMPTLVTDRLALEQIMSNLVENALKYLKPGRPGVIRIDAHRQNGRILITIADNGRGIDPRDHERIFDLFRRSGEQNKPGEGIGLAHVRALAYRLGGTISVESQLGEGATFTVDMPMVYMHDKDLAG